MVDSDAAKKSVRERVLSPVDRVSEMLFGLFMALSFVGAISVAEAGRAELREMFIAALGCNLAWGLVDAVMNIVRTLTERAKSFTLLQSVRAAQDPAAGRRLIADSMSPPVTKLFESAELEALRSRIVALEAPPGPPRLRSSDLVAGLAIFLVVVASTFPVVLPFAFIADVGNAMFVSRAIALAMLFLGGFALGRYAGYGRWRFGFTMMGLGTALVAAIMALGG